MMEMGDCWKRIQLGMLRKLVDLILKLRILRLSMDLMLELMNLLMLVLLLELLLYHKATLHLYLHIPHKFISHLKTIVTIN